MTDDTNDSPYLLPSQTITLTGGVVSKGRRGMTMTKTKSKWKTNKSSPLSENNFDWTMVALRQSIVYFGVRLCFIAFVSTMWILYCNSKNTDHNKRNVVALFFLADKAQVSSVRNAIIELKRLMAQIFRYQTSTYIFEFNWRIKSNIIHTIF